MIKDYFDKDKIKIGLLSGILFGYILLLWKKGFLNYSVLFDSKWKILSVGMMFFSIVMAAVVTWLMRKDSENKKLLIFAFGALWLMYCFRAPEDLLRTFLWAEDGVVLMRKAIEDGLVSVFCTTEQGTLWILPRFICYLSYQIVLLTDNYLLWPYLMAFIGKTISVMAIMYFLHDKFSWLIKERYKRFIVCCAVIMMIPVFSQDVISCDTSLAFTLLFTCFLIGLNCFCSDEYIIPTWKETVFLILVCLSSAAAPFVCASIFFGLLRLFYKRIKGNPVEDKEIKAAVIKNLIIMAGSILQVILIFISPRETGALQLADRLIYNVRTFMFMPFFDYFSSWKVFLVGVLVWVVLMLISKGDKRVVLFSGLYIFFFMMYCSFAYEATAYYESVITGNGRYVWLQSQISAFVIMYLILNIDTVSEKINALYLTEVIAVLIIVVPGICNYYINTTWANYAFGYSQGSCIMETDGEGTVLVSIDPTFTTYFPADPGDDIKQDLEITVDSISVKGEVISKNGYNYNEISQLNNMCIKPEVDGKTDLESLFLVYEGDVYRSASYKSGEEFVFELIQEGDVGIEDGALDFIGVTTDGKVHSGAVVVE